MLGCQIFNIYTTLISTSKCSSISYIVSKIREPISLPFMMQGLIKDSPQFKYALAFSSRPSVLLGLGKAPFWEFSYRK